MTTSSFRCYDVFIILFLSIIAEYLKNYLTNFFPNLIFQVILYSILTLYGMGGGWNPPPQVVFCW